MRVAITGSTGLIGSAFRRIWEAEGYRVTAVARRRRTGDPTATVQWSPSEGRIEAAGLEGHDVVVHLAGESIFGPWTAAKKRRIRDTRVRGTELLSRALAGLDDRPRVMLSASAYHYYAGMPGGGEVDETSPPGGGFLSDVTREWEAATAAAEEAGIRVAHMRFGLVVSGHGGALGVMVPIFRLGLGGPFGSGGQGWSWIALDEIPRAALHVARESSLRGPVNFVAPTPVSNLAFTRTLGRVLHRPTFFRVPGFVARLVLGQMAEELLLMGARARPHKLLESGYRFQWPDLELALRDAVAGTL